MQPRTASLRSHSGLLIFLLATFLLAAFLFTRHNSFPYTYHPDEDAKVRQIVSEKRNFFHPLLMLTTADVAMRIGQIEKTPEKAALTGRWVSAIFSALAVTALALLAWRWAGWAGGVAAAVLLTLNPLIFELAHYFKEDPALLLGLAVSFLALDVFWEKPTTRTAAFLGLGCTLAISGKYIGVVILLFALPLLAWRCRQNSWRLAGGFALGLFLPLFLINLPLFLDLPDFTRGLAREMDGATGGHRGLKREIPHAYYVGRINELTPWGLWLGLAATAGWAALRFRTLSATRWLTLVFPVFYFVLLSFSPKTAGRYLLPAEAFAAFLAVLSLESLTAKGTPILARLLSIGAVILALWSSSLEFRDYWQDFTSDSRSVLRIWIAEKTPANTRIAQDSRVDLEADPAWKARPVLSSEYVPDLGSLAELRQKGITHVAVARQVYNRYLDKSLKPSAKEKADFNRRAAFYQELFASGKPAWESPIGKVIYLHPGIRLYEIGRP